MAFPHAWSPFASSRLLASVTAYEDAASRLVLLISRWWLVAPLFIARRMPATSGTSLVGETIKLFLAKITGTIESTAQSTGLAESLNPN